MSGDWKFFALKYFNNLSQDTKLRLNPNSIFIEKNFLNKIINTNFCDELKLIFNSICWQLFHLMKL